jgi:transposase
MGRNTAREYREALAKAGLLDGAADALPDPEQLRAAVTTAKPPALAHHQVSSFESLRPRVVELVNEGLGPKVIFDRLRLEQESLPGGLSALKRLVRQIVASRGVQPADVAIPVETEPGEIAQVDFGYVGQLYDPKAGALRKAYVFVLVLGHSRHMFTKVVFDQKLDTWLGLHVEAFAALGGVVRVVVPDNLRAAVVRAAFRLDEINELNRSYRELARHYGFKIDPTPPYAPEKKGKVESGVKYVKNNFFRGREEEDVEEVQRDLAEWTRRIAGERTHGTTGWKPLERYEQVERATLLPLPARAWDIVTWRRAKVHRDCHVCFDGRLYSVPWRHVGAEVWVRATSHTVTLHRDDARLATHARSGREYRSTVEEHLPEGRRDLRHRSRTFWEERASRLGPRTEELVRAVFDSDDVLSQLRAVQGIVTHLERFPVERAENTAARALFFGNLSFRGVKEILTKALDQEPLPTTPVVVASDEARPRFARTASELFAHTSETLQ